MRTNDEETITRIENLVSRLQSEVDVARERLGPAGWRILKEVEVLRGLASVARDCRGTAVYIEAARIDVLAAYDSLKKAK